jgi:hypothetical protein
MKRYIGLGMTVLALVSLGACSGLPGYGTETRVPAPVYSDLVGEIQTVDPGRQQIELRTSDGRARLIGYDGRTRVLYRQQEYPVGSLERGDLIAVRTQDTGPRPYVDLITVQQSVQDRRGGVVVAPPAPAPTGPLSPSPAWPNVGAPLRLEGTVGAIDQQRGWFELRPNGTTASQPAVTVSLPFNARVNDAQRFQQLRSGQYVQLQGRYISPSRFEVENFF